MSQFLNKTSTAVMMLIVLIGLVVYFGWKAKKPTTKTAAELATEATEKAAAAI